MKITATMCLKDKESLKALFNISNAMNWKDVPFSPIVEAFVIMFPKVKWSIENYSIELSVKEVLDYVKNMHSDEIAAFLTSCREDGVIDTADIKPIEDILKGEVAYFLSLGYSLSEAMWEWKI